MSGIIFPQNEASPGDKTPGYILLAMCSYSVLIVSLVYLKIFVLKIVLIISLFESCSLYGQYPC